MNTLATHESETVLNGKPGLVDMANNLFNGRLDAFRSDAAAMVDELVERGEVVERQLKSTLKGKMMIEVNVAALMSRLGLGAAKQEKRLDELSSKVDKLIDAVTQLTEAREAKPEPKAAATKTAAKRKATSTAAKTTQSTAKVATKPKAKAPAKAPTAAKPATKPATRRRKPAAKAAEPVATDKPVSES